MFKNATYAILFAAALSSVMAAPALEVRAGKGGAAAAAGRAATSIGGQAANGAASAAVTWALNKIHREIDELEARENDLEARAKGAAPPPPPHTHGSPTSGAAHAAGSIAVNVGGQAANGAAGAATTWLLNKIHREIDEFDLEARAKGAAPPPPPHAHGSPTSGAAHAAGSIAVNVGGQAANGAAGAATTWLLNKIHREFDEFDLEARAKGTPPPPPPHTHGTPTSGAAHAAGSIAVNVGGQAANGAASAATTWLLNKIHREFDEFEAREDELEFEARDFEDYLEARDFEDFFEYDA